MMTEHTLSGQKVSYNGRTYHNVQVTDIEQDPDNRGIDKEYGNTLTYGCVALPAERNTFVVIQRTTSWVVIDTI